MKMPIPKGGGEDYSLVFIGVWHGFPVNILVLEIRSETILRLLLNEYPREKLVNAAVLMCTLITVLDQ